VLLTIGFFEGEAMKAEEDGGMKRVQRDDERV